MLNDGFPSWVGLTVTDAVGYGLMGYGFDQLGLGVAWAWDKLGY